MKNIRNKLRSIVMLAACLGGFSISASAVDGVVLITQANALAGNVTPGDTAGFPVTINTSGSYKLASNLSINNQNTTAIKINANNITIDLNGFQIIGNTNCSGGFGGPITCSPVGTGNGIEADIGFNGNLKIMNGIITGMGAEGIVVGYSNNIHIKDITVSSNGLNGIRCNASCIVESVSSIKNGENGIDIGSGTTISNSQAIQNGFTGIKGRGGLGINVFHCTAQSNGYSATDNTDKYGIDADLIGIVTNTTSVYNKGSSIVNASVSVNNVE